MEWFFSLPILWRILAYAVYWVLAQVSVGVLSAYLPTRFFRLIAPAFKTWSWEGWLYENIFLVRAWKAWLPEGGNWFRRDAFLKNRIASREVSYLSRYRLESIRGEFSHWNAFLFILPILSFAPGISLLINVGYLIIANGPCIIALRYNRQRIQPLLARRNQPKR